MPNAISIRNLSRSFGPVKAVHDISLDVKEHTIFGFLGRNGAGKTTTIRMMVGLLKPTKGSIVIAQKPTTFGKSAGHEHIGYLPEQPSLYPWMSGYEYLQFTARLFGLRDETLKQEVSKLLSYVGLKDAQHRRLGGYSNGMRQRLGIAQAIIGHPDVLILDEPVSALDPIGRREVFEIISQLKSSMTIFMTTHVLADVDRVCDEVAIINKGKIIDQAPLGELKSRYATPILSIEFEGDAESALQAAKGQPWSSKAEKNGNSLKIWLSSTDELRDNEPMRFFSTLGLPVMHYGLQLPDLEDIFVESIEKSEK